MSGWTPQTVWSQPRSVHERLVQMLLDDDKQTKNQPDGFTVDESVRTHHTT
jgi:hypothetical protein